MHRRRRPTSTERAHGPLSAASVESGESATAARIAPRSRSPSQSSGAPGEHLLRRARASSRAARRCAPRACRGRSGCARTPACAGRARCTRSVACCSTAGFHQRSKWKTWFAAGRLRPRPPARIEMTSTDGPPSLANAVSSSSRCRALSRPWKKPTLAVRAARARIRHEAVEARVLREDERLVVGAAPRASSSTRRSSLPGAVRRAVRRCARASPGGCRPASGARASRAPRRGGRSGPRAPRCAAASGRPSPGRGPPARPSAGSSPSRSVIGGRSSSTSGESFVRRRMNGRTIARSRSSAGSSCAISIGRCERAREPLARAEQARVEDVHQRPQLAEVVLERRAGHRERGAAPGCAAARARASSAGSSRPAPRRAARDPSRSRRASRRRA